MSAVIPEETSDLSNSKSNNLSKQDKPTKRHRKKSKRHRRSDPLVTNISNLLCSSLNLISPEKDVIKHEKILIAGKGNHDNDKKNEDKVVNSCTKKSPKMCPEINNENSPYLNNESVINDNINGHNIKNLDEEDGSESDIKAQSKNAFEFMMESRHKSIGRNSPGREIEKDTTIPSHEIKDKLNATKLVMEKWAISKGSKKRKVEEKDREIYIKYHLEARAKKMKKMLAVEDPIKIYKKVRKITSDSEDSQDTPIRKIQNVNNQKTKSDNLIEENDDENDTYIKINKSHLHQNNLRNFLTVTPKLESEKRKLSESDEFVSDENGNPNKEKCIKIKMFSQKNFKRAKRTTDVNSIKNRKIDTMEESEKIGKKHLRKLRSHKDIKRKISMGNKDEKYDFSKIQEKSDCMKRCETSINTRRKSSKNSTSKMLNEYCFNNSLDLTENLENNKDDLPRRSLRSRKINTDYSNSIATYLVDSDLQNNGESSGRKDTIKEEKNVKLAPIFLKTKTKSKIDPLVLKARRNFLMSGIPNALKKIVEKQQSIDDIDINFFPEISHVLQKSISKNGRDYWNLPKADIHTVNLNISLPKIKSLEKGSLNKYDDKKQQKVQLCLPEKIKNLKSILLEIKKNNPDYPVFRSFRLLKEKANGYKTEEPSKNLNKMNRKVRKKMTSKPEMIEAQHNNEFAMWTEKYKANAYADLIGNHTSTLELKKWLQGWLDVSENKSKIIRRRNSSGSEFDCDGESHDTALYPGNTVVVNGPHGSGKTMTVYALCNELGINVIELNASSKRTGKRLMQELQEATQSHQVRKNEVVDLNVFITRPANNKMKEQPINNSKMSLLLVEDVDVVFEQDEGFLAALTQLLSTSKRPIILAATDISSPSLQKIICQNHVVKFLPLSPKTISVWLQILCSLEGCFVNKDSLSELLEWNEGDVRKTLLELQFWIQSGGGNVSDKVLTKEIPNSDQFLLNDDTLSIEEVQGSQSIPMHSNCLLNFSDQTEISLEKVWWNLPQFTDLSPFTRQNNFDIKTKEIHETNSGRRNPEFSKLLNYFEAISEVDKTHVKSGIVGSKLSVKNALFTLKDSIELCEVYDDFNDRKNFIKDWSNSLVSGHMNDCKTSKEVILDMGLPNWEEKRWQNKQNACKREYMKMVSLSYHTDKKAFALDYFPCLRTITRSEETRCANTRKRKNRFYNYFRNLGFHCSDLISRTACDILDRNINDTEKAA